MKDAQGQAVSLLNVPMCGLNPLNGSRGVSDRNNIAEYAGMQYNYKRMYICMYVCMYVYMV